MAAGLHSGRLNSWLANFAMWCHARWMWCGSVVRAQIAKRRTKRVSRRQGTRWISRLFTMFSCSFWVSSFVPWKLEEIFLSTQSFIHTKHLLRDTNLQIGFRVTFEWIHHYNTKQLVCHCRSSGTLHPQDSFGGSRVQNPLILTLHIGSLSSCSLFVLFNLKPWKCNSPVTFVGRMEFLISFRYILLYNMQVLISRLWQKFQFT